MQDGEPVEQYRLYEVRIRNIMVVDGQISNIGAQEIHEGLVHTVG